MAELLKKNSKWDCVPEAANDIDYDDDEDNDDDNNDSDDIDENKQDSDDVASSVIQEICSEEPVQVSSDIKQIASKGIVEDEVKDTLEQKQKLSFSRMPSTTIPMYASVENTRKKTERCKKVSPFVEVKADNGSTIFIKKTTAVWLIQESERVSTDRFYRVRRKQPNTSQSKKLNKLNPIAITTTEPLSLEIPQCAPKTASTELDDDKQKGTSSNVIRPETIQIEVKDQEKFQQSTSLSTTLPDAILIVDDDVETPSQAWLKFNGITLYEIDKYSLLNDSSWMNGSHMTAVQL